MIDENKAVSDLGLRDDSIQPQTDFRWTVRRRFVMLLHNSGWFPVVC